MPITEQEKDRIRRALVKARKRQTSTVGVEPPRFVMVQYFRELQQLNKQVKKLVDKSLLAALKRREDELITDSLEADMERAVARLLREVDQWRPQFASKSAETAEKMAVATDKFNRAAFVAGIQKAVGVDIRDILTDRGVKRALLRSIRGNVGLIRSIPAQYLRRVEAILTQGIRGGDDFFSIKKDIDAQFGISSRRARVIARDQVGKLNGSLSMLRQKDVGIDHYVWRTSQDERVREDHANQNGKRYSWGKAPSKTGHPGHDIQCRCIAEPDLSDLADFLKAPAKKINTGARFGTSEKAQELLVNQLGPIKRERQTAALKKALSRRRKKLAKSLASKTQ